MIKRWRNWRYRKRIEKMTPDELREEAVRRGMIPYTRFLREKLHGGSFKGVKRES